MQIDFIIFYADDKTIINQILSTGGSGEDKRAVAYWYCQGGVSKACDFLSLFTSHDAH